MFLLTSVNRNLHSCTIFYLVGDSLILAGNNEDWKDPSPIMWFIPSEQGRYGWVKFGWGSGFPQGGMNERGLFWDGTSGPYLAMPYSETHKDMYPGPLMQKVIGECASVDEARTIFSQYYCEDLYKAQYLIGDAENQAMIVEGDSILQLSGDHLVLTNFIHSHPDLGGYPCGRYETATQMIETSGHCTTFLIGAILEATHQEGKYPTQYSQIYDLKSQSFYLFYYHNYEEFIHIDLKKELRKGERHYSIPELFAGIHVLTPDSEELLTGTSVEFSWEGNPDFFYTLCYATDPDFPPGNTSTITCQGRALQNDSYPMYGITGFFLLILMAGNPGKIKSIGTILVCGLLLLSCTKEKSSGQDEPMSWTQTITDLQPGSTYYWKINSHPISSEDFWSETVIRSFTTGTLEQVN